MPEVISNFIVKPRFLSAFISIFDPIRSWLKTWITVEDVPSSAQEESAELIRRHLAHQSWLDHVSALWTQKPILWKFGLMLALILSAGLFGPLPALVMALIGWIAHNSLQAHDHHRQEAIKMFADETVSLNQQLKRSQTLWNEKIQAISSQLDSLNHGSELMKQGIGSFTVIFETLKQQQETASLEVAHLNQTTQLLATQQQEAQAQLTQVHTELTQCSLEIVQTKTSLHNFGAAVSTFSATVQEVYENQSQLSQATQRFCLWVDEQVATEDGAVTAKEFCKTSTEA
jgi:methyl-accepting chemotaxis protein